MQKRMSEKREATTFVRGDLTGLPIPADGAALQVGGEAFLTDAFRAFGALDAATRVAKIESLEHCPGGSTGQKFFLTVAYDPPSPHLYTTLFVKFSRDFTDPIRDRGRYEMAAEVQFAAISHQPGFPIHVPAAYFADYHQASGTGVLITQRIAFGAAGIEPQHQKCLDHELIDPIRYYRTIIRALVRLAAAHKSGRLSAAIEASFPFDKEAAIASDPIRFDEAQLRAQVAAFAEFAAKYPQLLPPSLQAPAFFARLADEVGRFLKHELTIKRFLQSNSDLIALCHWNAHIDNAWFWRDDSGELQCGLIDWGRVRQMNVAYALWGCLSGASLDIWERHLPSLLELFVRELHQHGGPRLDVQELKLHLQLYVATMGIAWLLEAPARILFRLPAAATATGPHDLIFRSSETARNQLHIATVFLRFWQTDDFGAALDQMLARVGTL